MAEIKNSFIGSKMNKDIDDRLVANNEYREAYNISVGKSDEGNQGTIQNSLGNSLVNFGGVETDPTLKCIGSIADNQNNVVYEFLSNYRDNSNTLEPPTPGVYTMKIVARNFSKLTYTVLVQGDFLNFATNNIFRINGINIVENLLFWTDNRNQPRKINIASALNAPATSLNPYYTMEHQISVAKFAPVNPISLYTSIKTSIVAAINTTSFKVLKSAGVKVGMTIVSETNAGATIISGSEYILVSSVVDDANPLWSIVTVYSAPTVSTAFNINNILIFMVSTMSNQSSTPSWPGDPDYMKNKYIRFSYRFRFDDDEYSLIAPFTQIAYIPLQKGFFINGNETDAYRSTILSWMQNNVNNVELLITFPDNVINCTDSYKIVEIDILYKESDSLAVKVLDTVSISDVLLTVPINNVYKYKYQSRKPYRTLPSSEITRVYDRVPIRALAQEVSGNRLIYGNFVDKYTPPSNLNYAVAVVQKDETGNSFIEYPNHTLKQKRNYQVGFVLADKYGRDSSVILSSILDTVNSDGTTTFGGSTVFSDYSSNINPTNVKGWLGNTLSIQLNQIINSNKDIITGTPGLYAESIGNGFILTTSTTTTITNTTYIFTYLSGTLPVVGNYLRGAYVDYVKITLRTNVGSVYTVTTDGRVNDIYLKSLDNATPDVKFSYILNPLGWYSYKVVVRQREQDYYNVYLPGMLNGYPFGQTYGSQTTYVSSVPTLYNGINTTLFPTTESNKTANIVLLNDNINKIPRDLNEIGPDQKQYRSSVELWGRVSNIVVSSIASNVQYYPSAKPDVVTSISLASDSNFLPTTVTNPSGTASSNMYQLQSNPSIARISTVNAIGVTATSSSTTNMVPFLSVYETKPVQSDLDIFWETTTTGFISDINADVLNGFDGPIGLSETGFLMNECQDYSLSNPTTGGCNTKYITNLFNPINNSESPISYVTCPLNTLNPLTVVDGGGFNRTSDFGIETIYSSGTVVSGYRLYISSTGVFNYNFNASIIESYTFTINFLYTNAGITTNYPLLTNGSLQNTAPTITGSPQTSFSITQQDYLIYTFTGVNGSTSGGTTGLNWSISGDNVSGNISINANNGQLFVSNPDIPAGTYTVLVTLTDAWDNTNNISSVGSLTNTLEITVTVGLVRATNPNGAYLVPLVLFNYATNTATEGITTNLGGINNFTDGYVNCHYDGKGTQNAYPYKYGLIYVGNDNVTLNSSGTPVTAGVTLPSYPNPTGGGTSSVYQFASNLPGINGGAQPGSLATGGLLISLKLTGGYGAYASNYCKAKAWRVVSSVVSSVYTSGTYPYYTLLNVTGSTLNAAIVGSDTVHWTNGNKNFIGVAGGNYTAIATQIAIYTQYPVDSTMIPAGTPVRFSNFSCTTPPAPEPLAYTQTTATSVGTPIGNAVTITVANTTVAVGMILNWVFGNVVQTRTVTGINAAKTIFTLSSTVNGVLPTGTGLTFSWGVIRYGTSLGSPWYPNCSGYIQNSKLDVIVYFRATSSIVPNPNPWIADTDNTGTLTNQFTDGVDGQLYIRGNGEEAGAKAQVNREVKFELHKHGEWAIVTRLYDTSDASQCCPGPTVSIKIQDAFYSGYVDDSLDNEGNVVYDVVDESRQTSFFTQLWKPYQTNQLIYGYPTAIPYTTQSLQTYPTTVGTYTVTTLPSGYSGNGYVNINVSDEKIVPGLRMYLGATDSQQIIRDAHVNPLYPGLIQLGNINGGTPAAVTVGTSINFKFTPIYPYIVYYNSDGINGYNTSDLTPFRIWGDGGSYTSSTAYYYAFDGSNWINYTGSRYYTFWSPDSFYENNAASIVSSSLMTSLTKYPVYVSKISSTGFVISTVGEKRTATGWGYSMDPNTITLSLRGLNVSQNKVERLLSTRQS